MKTYIFYEKTNPFPGWIRGIDQVDVDQVPDGSTKKERYIELLVKYPDSAIKQFPFGDLPDPEAVKYDQATQALVPLDPSDITPTMVREDKINQADIKLALLAKKTYAQASDSVQNGVTNLPTAKNAIELNRLVILAILKKLDMDS